MTVPLGRTVLALFLLFLVGVSAAGTKASSTQRPITIEFPDGTSQVLTPSQVGGGAQAFPVSIMAGFGWVLTSDASSTSRLGGGSMGVLRHPSGVTIGFTVGAPFIEFAGEPFHLADPFLMVGGSIHAPLQLLVDFLPGILPAAYTFDPATRIFRVRQEGPVPAPSGAQPPVSSQEAGSPPPPPSAQSAQPPTALSAAGTGTRPPPAVARAPRSRLVVIDPGHGGSDPGAIGPGGTREKDVALAVALALARQFAADPWIEVRLTRDRDVFVPLWDRGLQATEWKGNRPGVFLSIHANSVGERRDVRGFETYFLSEARTEHERRVAAVENAPLQMERATADVGTRDPLLASILRDLITFDHQHWSAALAEDVQRELGRTHPGPDRGVKQGPFAVITNSLMPSVLIELGFISHPEEERLLMRPEFHEQSARAIANAVRRFFDRYPPGGGE
jgi:N-acetylmuramoyl-L-alanine amidase